MSGDFSIGTCALLAIRLGSISFGLSLPYAANGRFKAMISCDLVPGIEPGGAAGGRWRRSLAPHDP
jgi:hypothetical protein